MIISITQSYFKKRDRNTYSTQDIAAKINGKAEITVEDINNAVKKTKTNKAPGLGNKKGTVEIWRRSNRNIY